MLYDNTKIHDIQIIKKHVQQVYAYFPPDCTKKFMSRFEPSIQANKGPSDEASVYLSQPMKVKALDTGREPAGNWL